MKLNEIKDYLSDKKDNVKNYIMDKKDSIKDGAKKAVATGLVVSTLLSGSAMMTACDNDKPIDSKYQNESETLKSIASQVEKYYKQAAEEIYSDYEEEFSDLLVYKDLQGKSMLFLAGEKSVWNASYEISSEEYDKLYSLAIASGNENIEVDENRIYVDRENLNDSSLNHFAEEILNSIEGKTTTQYLDVEDWLYNKTFHQYVGYEYYDSPNDEIIIGMKDYTEKYERLQEENGYVLEEYKTIDTDEIRVGKVGNKFWNPGDSYNNPTGVDYTFEVHVMDNVDTNGDGIDDTREYLKFVASSNVSHTRQEGAEAFERLLQVLEIYEGDENIRQGEDGMWYINPEILGDGKYAVFNDAFRIVLYASSVCDHAKSYSDDPNTYVSFIYEEPIQQEQSMEK